MTETTLVLGQFLVANADSPPLTNAGIAVQGTKVVGTGSNSDLRQRYPLAEVVDRPDSVIGPGFVNTHHHMYGVLSHGIPQQSVPSGFWPFLKAFWWPKVEDALTHDLIAAATEWACLEMVNSGITSFYDCLEAPNAIPGALEVEAAIVDRWGLRGCLSFEATERQSLDNGREGLEENARLIRKWNDAESLVSGMMCFHTTFTCSRHFIDQAFGLARDLKTKVHMHLSEGTHEPDYCLRTYGLRTVELYHQWGLLGPDVLASQCVQVSPTEIQLLAKARVSVSHMPLSNCEVGGGFAPVPEMLDQGIRVGLGTDGYINDFFELMRGACLMPKARLQDPAVMPAKVVWKMATEDGARTLGWEDVGRLQPGYSADIVVVRTDFATPPAPHNLLDQLLLWRNAGHISDVMIAGQWLKRDGQVLGADPSAILAQCREAAQQLWERGRG
jgi:cytosine/adenosine deaminase-related metal-dependent hydrolase